MRDLFATSVLVALAAAGSAEAAVVDFVSASNDGTTLVATDLTATAAAGTVLVVGDFIDNALCPQGDFGCNGAFTLTFDADAINVAFQYGWGDAGDSALLSIFDALGSFMGSVALALEDDIDVVDLSGFGPLRTIVFDNTAATGAGYAYGEMTYTLVDAVVPLPATLPMLLAGAGALVLAGRRRRG
jgi:hypothetical protein